MTDKHPLIPSLRERAEGRRMTGPRPAGQRWTKADDNQLRAMLEADAKPPEIARKLKRTIMQSMPERG
jgi:hypothetical protein